MRRGPKLKISTQEPLLKDIFERQRSIGLLDTELCERTGFNREKIARLRNPSNGMGKTVTTHDVRMLAAGVGLVFVGRCLLAKDRPPNRLAWIGSIEEVRS